MISAIPASRIEQGDALSALAVDPAAGVVGVDHTTVICHGWQIRAYMEVLAACRMINSHNPAAATSI